MDEVEVGRKQKKGGGRSTEEVEIGRSIGRESQVEVKNDKDGCGGVGWVGKSEGGVWRGYERRKKVQLRNVRTIYIRIYLSRLCG